MSASGRHDAKRQAGAAGTAPVDLTRMSDAGEAPGRGEAGEAEVVERGDVFFFYRPRVKPRLDRAADDVQRFLLVLAPDGRRLYRVVTIGRKHLPRARRTRRERTWGF